MPKEPKSDKKKKFCAESGCRKGAMTQGYCRLHYLANWRHIKLDKKIKAENRLNSFVDRIAKKYPKDFMERIKEGLEDEGKFKQAIQELDIEAEPGAEEVENEFLEKFLRAVKPGIE